MTFLCSTALVFFLSGMGWPGASAPETKPTPRVSAAAEVKELIEEGVVLHDREDFDGAIERYRRALEIDPGDGRALFEMAFSLYEKKDLKGALEFAERASLAPQPSRKLAVMMGNIYDDLGEPKKAIEAYRRGLVRDPNYFLLYFNLGTTYERLGQLDSARVAYQNAVACEPRHTSSHFHLARVYKKQGYRVPAILAATRFLTLENATARSEAAVGWLEELFTRNVTVDGENKTNVTMNVDGPKDEGDFEAADLMVSLVQVSKNLEDLEVEGSFEMHRLAQLLSMVGELAGQDRGKGFAVEYYVPFVDEVVKRKAASGLAATALRGTKSKEIDAWIAAHEKEMSDFADIAKTFKWPEVRPPLRPDEATAQEKEKGAGTSPAPTQRD